MKIYAFQGYRYTPSAGDPGALAAPPFDQIDDCMRDRLHACSPYHYSHFTRPVAQPGEDVYAVAAALHAAWIESGAVARDRTPSLYPYVVASAAGSRRAALCCLVAVGRPGDSDLRPHEQTVDKPLADRLALLRATAVDPEPVMLLAEDDGSFEARLWSDLEGLQPLVEHLDGEDNRHQLYRLDDVDRIRAYQRLLEPRSATIADGHHRCKTAQLFAAETGAPEGTAAAAKMAVLISVASPQLQIDPIHRAVEAPLDGEAMATVTLDRRPFGGDSGTALAAAVAAAEAPALGVWLADAEPQIWQLDATQAPPTTPAPARALSAVLLHYMVLPKVGVELAAATDGTVIYRSDPQQLFEERRQRALASAFWLPPMAPSEFAQAVSEGDLLPPKSTRFMPKLISGMVWCGHDARLL